MAEYAFSVLARADLREIAAYTRERWGKEQARLYVEQLRHCAQRLAASDLLGRPCHHVRPDLLRINQGSHVILFRRQEAGVLVCRILHKRMMVTGRPIDDTDPEEG